MGHCFLRVSDCAVFSAANWPPLYQGEVNIYRQTGGGKESISLFAVYTKGCFIFAPLHGIYSLNLSNVICTVTESAVLISYIHESHALPSVRIPFLLEVLLHRFAAVSVSMQV